MFNELLINFGFTDFNTTIGRKESYNFVENFISNQSLSMRQIDTPAWVQKFESELQDMTDIDIAYLLIHTGYIPEQYDADSSEETLYSKLCEAIIREWALRIGFTDSYLPTMKSSTEDVTIIDGQNVIVCDGKAFRLGRSQRAPNVKDMLKEGDIKKWLKVHKDKGLNTIGGLVVFPSPHDWTGSTDFYSYTSNHTSPILALNYEHLSYILANKLGKESILNILNNYHTVFPNPLPKDRANSNRDLYHAAIENKLFGHDIQRWHKFKELVGYIISEKCLDTSVKLKLKIDEIANQTTEEINKISNEELRVYATKALIETKTMTLKKQLANIHNHRKVAQDYYDDKN